MFASPTAQQSNYAPPQPPLADPSENPYGGASSSAVKNEQNYGLTPFNSPTATAYESTPINSNGPSSSRKPSPQPPGQQVCQ